MQDASLRIEWWDIDEIRYDVKGHLTTVGYVSWHDNVADADASLVKVMKDAGGMSRSDRRETVQVTRASCDSHSNAQTS